MALQAVPDIPTSSSSSIAATLFYTFVIALACCWRENKYAAGLTSLVLGFFKGLELNNKFWGRFLKTSAVWSFKCILFSLSLME